MHQSRFSVVFTTLLAVLVLAVGCGESDPTAPPDGWETDGDRWWHSDTDTADVFPDQGDMQAMGILDEEDEELAIEGDEVSGEVFLKGVKRGLDDFYKSNPAIIDSLFDEYAAPELGTDSRSGEVEEQVQEAVQEARNLLDDYYRRPEVQEQEDISYPRDLYEEGIEGNVELQVRVNSSGDPVAIRVVESVHPELDAIAMRSAALMRASPARVRYSEDEEWEDIEGWIHFDVPFQV
ncbi:MAG: TonB family protein [Longimonas sp.]|uniref:energy transducer TonB n=1 Tax=Longimonas sp. TaxID=2039626 RepID=UPI003976F2EF